MQMIGIIGPESIADRHGRNLSQVVVGKPNNVQPFAIKDRLDTSLVVVIISTSIEKRSIRVKNRYLQKAGNVVILILFRDNVSCRVPFRSGVADCDSLAPQGIVGEEIRHKRGIRPECFSESCQ